MNAYLRDKMLQKLETLSDERGYQILDYIDFLESRYAERAATTGSTAGNPLSRFADAVEEKLRAGKVSASTIAETMGFMTKAVGVLNGAAAAGKSVASDLMSATGRVVDAATTAATSVSGTGRPAGGDSGANGTTGASAGAPVAATGGAGPAPGAGPGTGN